MPRSQRRSQRGHQIDDRRSHVRDEFVQEGVADEAGQQDRVDPTALEAANEAEGVQLARGRVVALVGAAGVARKTLLLEDDRVAFVVGPRLDRADQTLQQVGAGDRAEPADHPETEPAIDRHA